MLLALELAEQLTPERWRAMDMGNLALSTTQDMIVCLARLSIDPDKVSFLNNP